MKTAGGRVQSPELEHPARAAGRTGAATTGGGAETIGPKYRFYSKCRGVVGKAVNMSQDFYFCFLTLRPIWMSNVGLFLRILPTIRRMDGRGRKARRKTSEAGSLDSQHCSDLRAGCTRGGNGWIWISMKAESTLPADDA